MKARTRSRLLIILALAVLTAALRFMPAEAQTDGVSDARFARLARGINLAFWFWRVNDINPDTDNRFEDEDFALIRNLGFTHVRMPIDLGWLIAEDRDDLMNPERLAAIDRALDRLLAHDLAVIVDIHSSATEDNDNNVYSGRLETDKTFEETFIRFWRSFAAHLSARDPEMVFLQVLNEPVFQRSPNRWVQIQTKLLAAMREGAPEHTLIATSARWSNIDTLINMAPVQDKNVVYDFHFYEPMTFTHQGAEWVSEGIGGVRAVPYPTDPRAIEFALRVSESRAAQTELRQYGASRYSTQQIMNRIDRAARWARRFGVRLVCTEFGVYKVHAPRADRARWLSDVRQTFEVNNIGWAMWEYDYTFGIVDRLADGTRVVDELALEALGLRSPAQ